MRVLWFSVIPLLAPQHGVTHNGGGWISSLMHIVLKHKEIELGIAYNLPADPGKSKCEGVTYYAIAPYQPGIIKKITHRIAEEDIISPYLKVVEDFQPDLIQIFGSESDFGLICKHVNVPIVIHLQGSLPPYSNALFPVGMNLFDFLFTRGLPFRKRIMGLLAPLSFKRNSEREINIIQSCQYFMGRTNWDRGLIELFNPKAQYYHCEEALRDSFIQSPHHWEWKERKEKVIVSVISQPWYKGVDLILKTAQLLKRFTDINFKWHIYGIKDISFFEHKYNIKASEENVYPKGTASKEELVSILLEASCFVHPSYIENSPNSICEAQLLGVPVVATHVGGVATLLKNGEAGILIPTNAPYTLANTLSHLVKNQKQCELMSANERQTAFIRHDPETIKRVILRIYQDILHQKK